MKKSSKSKGEDAALAELKKTSKFRPADVVVTAEHKAALQQLKDEFDDLPDWVDDKMCLRFLRVKHFDVDATSEMLANHIAWVESFEEWPRERIEEQPEFKAAIGYVLPEPDYFGRPIVYVRPRLINPAHRTDAEGVKQVFCSMVREANAMCKEHGTESCVILYDLHGFAARNRDNTTMKMQIDVMEQHEPSGLGNIIFCRYPWLLFPVFAVAKLWLDKATTDRVVFCDDLADLNQLTHRKNIPEGLGGELKEREPSFEIWPKKTGGWFSGWFGSSSDTSTAAPAAEAAAGDDDDADPLAGLSEKERKEKLAQMEKAELESAAKLEAELKAKEPANKPQQKRRRRKGKR